MWSDESTFSQFQQSRCSRVWREPQEKWNISCVSATVKHSPSRMFWGCFSRQGLGPIVPLFGTANGATHVIILHKHIMPTMRHTFPNGDSIFQKDNARPTKQNLQRSFMRKMIYAYFCDPLKVQTSIQLKICELMSRKTFVKGKNCLSTWLNLTDMLRRHGGKFLYIL